MLGFNRQRLYFTGLTGPAVDLLVGKNTRSASFLNLRGESMGIVDSAAPRFVWRQPVPLAMWQDAVKRRIAKELQASPSLIGML